MVRGQSPAASARLRKADSRGEALGQPGGGRATLGTSCFGTAPQRQPERTSAEADCQPGDRLRGMPRVPVGTPNSSGT
jgi:hypothetical protein